MTIDWWTLGLQTINVAVLIWLLGRFFWRPVAAMIEERRATAERILTEAEAERQKTAAASADIERTRVGMTQEREAILLAAREEAERERAARLAEVAKDGQALEAAARAAIETEAAETEKAWAGRASQLAVSIAERLAARLDGLQVRDAFLSWLLEEIRALPEPARRAVTASGVTLEAITAAPLDPAEQDRYRDLIGGAFDAHPQITFTADRSLIAGLELRGPHFVVSNSWRADLDRIKQDLAHANQR